MPSIPTSRKEREICHCSAHCGGYKDVCNRTRRRHALLREEGPTLPSFLQYEALVTTGAIPGPSSTSNRSTAHSQDLGGLEGTSSHSEGPGQAAVHQERDQARINESLAQQLQASTHLSVAGFPNQVPDIGTCESQPAGPGEPSQPIPTEHQVPAADDRATETDDVEMEEASGENNGQVRMIALTF